MLRAAIYERHWHPPCIVRRSSSLSVVHAHVRDNHRLVAIKTAFARLAKSWRTTRFLEGRRETIKLYRFQFAHAEPAKREFCRASQHDDYFEYFELENKRAGAAQRANPTTAPA